MAGHVVTNNDVHDLTHGLQALDHVQQVVSGMVPGAKAREGEVGPAQILTYGFALLKEVTELMDELHWKPWKTAAAPDRDRVADEFADVLAFLGLITIYVRRMTGLTAEDLARAYARKSQVNVDRFSGKVAGYQKQEASEAVDER